MEKQGVPLGIDAIHPITGEKIPVWAANFVLMEYGSGALMAVPAHDQRDYEFAVKYDLPIKQVIQPEESSACNLTKSAYTGYGTLIDSAQFTGLQSQPACTSIAAYVEEHHIGKLQINFRLRDWSISRQRYWGTPLPIINCTHCGAVPVPEKDLPVVLPVDVTFTGVTSPLKSMPSFLNTTCPKCHAPAERETDTFDTFIESSWYYTRYTCKKQDKSMLDGRANYWVPVDQYSGGIEHAVMHLLYARFFHKLMRDEGLLNSDEPFIRLLTQGMVLNQGSKMSKSKGNVVDPQELIAKYGADTVRLFMMFAAPPEQSLEWSDSGVEGAFRYLKRVWAFAVENHDIIYAQNHLPHSNKLGTANWENADAAQTDIFRQVYEILDQAKFDYERQQFNTVVSSCMKILNLIAKIPDAADGKVDIKGIITHKGFSILLRLLSPITPHISHQLWTDLDYQGLILDAEWPKSSALVFKVDTVELVVQVNGKLRSRVRIAHDADQATIESTVINDSKVQLAVSGKTVKKIIIVPGKLVNVVVAGE
jgi:leucyl-tRNA synthetase